jgi:Resolvase, N terminal domain
MLIGYMRVSKADGSQSTDLQRDALRAAGVATRRLYEDRASGRLDARPGLSMPHSRRCAAGIPSSSGSSTGWDATCATSSTSFTTSARGAPQNAEFEREILRDPVKAGIAQARQQGKPPRSTSDR